MFDGFSFKSVLYPAEKVVDTLIDALKIDKKSVDTKALVGDLNEKEQCTMKNPQMRLDAYNGYLKNSFITIEAFNVKSFLLIFPKTYLKSVSTLRLDGVEIDLLIELKDKLSTEPLSSSTSSAKSTSSNPLMKVINMFIRNIKVQINNLHIRIHIGKEIAYSLMVKHISFEANERNIIDDTEKTKSIFLHNKLIIIKHLLFKENINEKDYLFFNYDEKETANQALVYINKDTLFINHNDIIIDFSHNADNKELHIANSQMPFYFECVVTKKQFGQMMNALGMLNRLFTHFIANDNHIKSNILEESTPIASTPTPTSTPTHITQEVKKAIDLFGFPMNTISFDITLSCFYYALIDNLQDPKAKIWMIYENQFKSYYDLKDSSSNQNELIQKHLIYHNENFLMLYLDNAKYSLTINTTEKQTQSQGAVKSIEVKFIQPNQVKNKKDILIIRNTESNDFDKLFNENFFKYFFSVIKYGAYPYPIVTLDKIELKTIGKTIRFTVNQIALDFNPIIMSHLISLYNINQLIDINFEQGNRVKDIDKRLPLLFEISVTKLNIRILNNKKNLKLYQRLYEVYYKKMVNNNRENREKIYYNETYQQQINVLLANIQLKHSSLNSSISYVKLICCYVNNNLVYPFLFQTNNDKEINYTLVLEKSEKEVMEENCNQFNVMTLSAIVNEVLLFYNPRLVYKVLSYIQLLTYSFKILTSFIKTEKFKAIENHYVKEIRLQCKVKELQMICVSGINLPKQRRDVSKLIDDNERLFKLFFNPMLKVKISNSNLGLNTNGKQGNAKLSIDNIKLMIRTSQNRFGKENASYQLVLEDQREEDNYEFITFNPSIGKDCLKAQIDFTITTVPNDYLTETTSNDDDLATFVIARLKTTSTLFSPISSRIELNNFVLAPLPLKLYEIVDSIDQMKHETITLNGLISKAFNYSSEVIEIVSYEKFKPFNTSVAINILHSNDSLIHKMIYDITISINNLSIDLFCDNKINCLYRETNEDLNSSKDKMRLITQMTSLIISLHNTNSISSNNLTHSKPMPFVSIKLSELNTIFMKNLDILSESSMPLNNKTDSIASQDSFWRSIGFALIFSLKDLHLDYTKLFVHSINVYLCFDSLKYLLKFISQIKTNIKKIQSLFEYIIEDDHESVITDIYQYQDNNSHSYVEYRSINQIQSEKNNNVTFIDNRKKQPKDFKAINVNENIIQSTNQKNAKQSRISFLFYSIKISFYQGEDFNFQGRYTATQIENESQHHIALPNEKLQVPNINNNDSPIKEDNKAQSYIENINKRDENNYITLLLIKIEAKSSYYE